MSREAQFSVGFIRNIFFYASSRGADLDHLCRSAGIPRERLGSPDEMVSGALVERAWQVAIEQTGDPDLGLHLGETVQPAALGLLGLAMLSSEPFGAALDRLTRYWNLMSDATNIRSRVTGVTATLELEILDLPGNFLLHNRHPVESSLSAIMGLSRSLTGRALPLSEVACTYPPPQNPREYERIFGRPARFHAESNHISFPREALAWPVIHANPALLSGFDAQIARRLENNPQTTTERVRSELARKIRGDVPDLADVAKSLHTSERALQRELQKEGTTFRQVLDDLRKNLAMDYLRDPRHSIADVSFLLGFSEPSVLHRYFRRWLGVTPQSYRRSLETASPVANHQPA